MTNRTALFNAITKLTRLADELEALQMHIMALVPEDARRGDHLYECAHGLGGIPTSIRRSRGRVMWALREMERMQPADEKTAEDAADWGGTEAGHHSPAPAPVTDNVGAGADGVAGAGAVEGSRG